MLQFLTFTQKPKLPQRTHPKPSQGKQAHSPLPIGQNKGQTQPMLNKQIKALIARSQRTTETQALSAPLSPTSLNIKFSSLTPRQKSGIARAYGEITRVEKGVKTGENEKRMATVTFAPNPWREYRYEADLASYGSWEKRSDQKNGV